MKIVDLTSAYPPDPTEDQAIATYEGQYQALFDHYNEYWTVREYPYCLLSADEIEQRKSLVIASLDFQEHNFMSAGLDISEIKIVLFVGKGTSNGHAWQDGSQWLVWLPVETYMTRLSAEVFIAHEIAHALHYSETSGFYFANHAEKKDLLRQLICEGLATSVSQEVGDFDEATALWADYLAAEKVQSWTRECESQMPQLAANLLSAIDSGEDLSYYFRADDENNIAHFRAGYFVGVRLIQQIATSAGTSASDLLSMPCGKLKNTALDQLRSMATVL